MERVVASISAPALLQSHRNLPQRGAAAGCVNRGCQQITITRGGTLRQAFQSIIHGFMIAAAAQFREPFDLRLADGDIVNVKHRNGGFVRGQHRRSRPR